MCGGCVVDDVFSFTDNVGAPSRIAVVNEPAEVDTTLSRLSETDVKLFRLLFGDTVEGGFNDDPFGKGDVELGGDVAVRLVAIRVLCRSSMNWVIGSDPTTAHLKVFP